MQGLGEKFKQENQCSGWKPSKDIIQTQMQIFFKSYDDKTMELEKRDPSIN